MIRIVFLIALFAYNLWGLYRYIRLRIDPSDAVKALEECKDEDASKLIGSFIMILTASLYIIVLTLNSMIVPSEFLTVALIICAALELIILFPRIHRLIDVYSGDDKVQKYLQNLKSFTSLVGFIWNVAETGIMGAAIYIILKELA